MICRMLHARFFLVGLLPLSSFAVRPRSHKYTQECLVSSTWGDLSPSQKNSFCGGQHCVVPTLTRISLFCWFATQDQLDLWVRTSLPLFSSFSLRVVPLCMTVSFGWLSSLGTSTSVMQWECLAHR